MIQGIAWVADHLPELNDRAEEEKDLYHKPVYEREERTAKIEDLPDAIVVG